MVCPHCSQPVAESATFCGSCGKPLVEGVHADRAGFHAGRELATFWPRFGALLIDALVIGLSAAVFAGVFLTVGVAITPSEGDPGEAVAIGTILGVAGTIALAVGLSWRFHARGTSPGARIAHVRIVDRDGNAPGAFRGLARMLVAYVLSGNLMNLGYLWAIWDHEKRTWHDHLAGTWVVRDRG